MKLWLLCRKDCGGYDTFDSAVIAAETKEEARHIHPGGSLYGEGKWWKDGPIMGVIKKGHGRLSNAYSRTL